MYAALGWPPVHGVSTHFLTVSQCRLTRKVSTEGEVRLAVLGVPTAAPAGHCATTHKIRLGADKLEIEVAGGKPVSIKAGSASFEIDASQNVTIKGNKVTIEAQTELTLTATRRWASPVRGSSVQGSMVAVKGQGTTSVEASGPLTLKGAMVAIN
jgi:uncharacterized protein (DUF2345 family)